MVTCGRERKAHARRGRERTDRRTDGSNGRIKRAEGGSIQSACADGPSGAREDYRVSVEAAVKVADFTAFRRQVQDGGAASAASRVRANRVQARTARCQRVRPPGHSPRRTDAAGSSAGPCACGQALPRVGAKRTALPRDGAPAEHWSGRYTSGILAGGGPQSGFGGVHPGPSGPKGEVPGNTGPFRRSWQEFSKERGDKRCSTDSET